MSSLRRRIAFTYALLISLGMIALGLLLLRAEERVYRAALDDRLTAEARLVATLFGSRWARPDEADAIDALTKQAGAEITTRLTVIAADGVVLGDSKNDPAALDNHATRPEVQRALAGETGRASRTSATEGRPFRYVAVPISSAGQVVGVVRAATPTAAIDRDLRRTTLNIAIAVLIAGLLAGVPAALIANAITRPVARLHVAVRALADGDLTSRAPVEGAREARGLATAFNDMADRLRTTFETLSAEHARLDGLLSASADAIIAVDTHGAVRYANPAAIRLFGPAADRPFAEVARQHELHELLRRVLANGTAATIPIRLLQPDRWLQATISPIAGGGWAALVLLHDVTDARQAEVSRREFVANVSHELRTPLAGIKAVVETLRDGALDDPAVADDFLGRVDAEVDRIIQLVEELLQLARLESGAAMQLAPLAPASVLAAVHERFAHQAERAGVKLVIDPPPPLPHIEADAARLGQAVGNLVHNALKFTPPGGTVTLAAHIEGDRLRFTVRDTGSGIDPADLPRIFERFYVADRARAGRGTGLGLAIVKHVALAHGGAAEATSTLGAGATFTISLPLTQPDARAV